MRMIKLETHANGKVYVRDEGRDLAPGVADLRLWDTGHVQLGSFGHWLPVQTLQVGDVCKFKLGSYVVAVKRVEESPPPTPKATIIKLSDRRKFRRG